jgi:hypothetical protein
LQKEFRAPKEQLTFGLLKVISTGLSYSIYSVIKEVPVRDSSLEVILFMRGRTNLWEWLNEGKPFFFDYV